MPDVFSKSKRSEVMSKIRGKGNKDTELALIKIFKEYQISGWRRGLGLIGKPDFTFRKQKTVIFVDGCFWHGCPRHSNVPVNNRIFWINKLEGNKVRDNHVNRELKNLGWQVVRIWEHDLSNPTKVVGVIKARLGLPGKASRRKE